MKIVEYADFLCPHCHVAYTKLHTLAESKSGVQIIFQSFPLDGCAGTAESPGLRCQLAMSALCAEQVGKKGWNAHEYLFTNQEKIAEGNSITSTLENMNTTIGLDTTQMETCMKNPTTLETIKKQMEGGKKLGIKGTPAIFINNKKFSGPTHLPLLMDLHDKIAELPQDFLAPKTQKETPNTSTQ